MTEFQFTNRDWLFLIAGLCCGVLSLFLFTQRRYGISVLALTLCGFLLRLVMITVDPYLSMWDEQYHALVAKNLAQHFFTPTLVDAPLQATDPAGWVYTHYWLHKPPLFLWQMALAVKLLGAKAWVIRIPSLMLSTLMIPVMYRMGKLVASERVGFVAAILFSFSGVMIYMISGFLNTDHNDVAFMAYVCFSFWCWMEYVHRPTWKWAILVGVFAGAAVLTKWLPGLMVFGAWGIYMLNKNNRSETIKWKQFITAFCVSVLIAVPWFVYAASQWPAESAAAMNIYSSHLNDALGHPGPWWYHFQMLSEQNGLAFAILSAIALIVFAVAKVRIELRAGLIAVVLIVYLFYASIPVRMPFFCLPVVPLIFLFVAFAIDTLMSRLKKIAAVVAGCGICVLLIFSSLAVKRSTLYHAPPEEFADYRKTKIYNHDIFANKLKDIPENAVVFDCSSWDAIPCMFFVNCTAFDQLPDETQVNEAKSQLRPVYVFDDGKLPEWITADSSIQILPFPLIRNGW